ncbi:porin [Paraburkholderia sp. CNPSo 3076]|uniref:porin n=1 Tax=Paraburkholderia sp. CNPSo 3076 TaxID=2940936 RepID=UPI00224FB546|nr:porin [Paraburkholderia sp. CNPSo 3076]MCX5542112.1 porin [Paraburkholderia sp. CNPSo 3076]
MRSRLGSHIIMIAFAGNAYAQSSTTLYGLVETGIVYSSNQHGHATVQFVNGQTQASRFGLRGTEDLGGGLRAIFTLENGFDPSSGKLQQNSRMFGRQAFVGLSGAFGTFTMGRQYEPVYEYVGAISGTSLFSWFGAHPADLDNMQSFARVNNALKYRTPDYAGFSAEGLIAPGGVAGNFGENRVYSASVGYNRGPFVAAVGFANFNNPSVTAYDGSVSPGAAGYTSPVNSPVDSGYASARSLQIFAAGASYRIGDATAGVVYTNTRFVDVFPTATTPFSGTARFNTYEANLQYRLRAALLLAAEYDFTDGETARYNQVHLGAIYSLSKRTDFALMGVWQHAGGKDSTGKSAVAAIPSLTASSTSNQLAVKVTMRHRF